MWSSLISHRSAGLIIGPFVCDSWPFSLGFSQVFRFLSVSARNVFRYLCSIFMFAAFLVIFVFAPLVLLFGSLVFHCPRSFVLRVRIFLHIVYLAFIVIFRVSSSFSCAWSGLQFNVWVLLVLGLRPYLAIVFTAVLRYTSLYFAILRYTSLCFTSVHLFPCTSCRSSRIKFVC